MRCEGIVGTGGPEAKVQLRKSSLRRICRAAEATFLSMPRFQASTENGGTASRLEGPGLCAACGSWHCSDCSRDGAEGFSIQRMVCIFHVLVSWSRFKHQCKHQ